MSTHSRPDHPSSGDSISRAASLFLLLSVFTATLFLVSRTGLVGGRRAFVLFGLAGLQAGVAATLLLGVAREQPWVKGLLLLVLFVLIGLLVGPTFSALTAPV